MLKGPPIGLVKDLEGLCLHKSLVSNNVRFLNQDLKSIRTEGVLPTQGPLSPGSWPVSPLGASGGHTWLLRRAISSTGGFSGSQAHGPSPGPALEGPLRKAGGIKHAQSQDRGGKRKKQARLVRLSG